METSTSKSTRKVPNPNDTFGVGPSDTQIPRSTDERHNRFARELADELEGIDYATSFKSDKQARDYVAAKKREVAERTGVTFGSLDRSQQAALGDIAFKVARATADTEFELAKEGKRAKVTSAGARDAVIAGLGVTPARHETFDTRSADRDVDREFERAKSDGYRARVREEDSVRRGLFGGAPRSSGDHSSDAPKTPPKVDPDDLDLPDKLGKLQGEDIVKYRTRVWKENFGFSGTAASKYAKTDLAPERLVAGATVDASKVGMNAQTARKLQARGIRVINLPGVDRKEFAGYSKRELATGQVASAGSAQGQARLEGQRGLFRRKRIYESDGKGGVIATADLAPKYSVGGAKNAAKSATFGAAKRGIEARRMAREERKLQNPLYRSRKILRLERNRHLVDLQGRLGDSSGFQRWMLTQRIRLTSFALMNLGWLTFILTVSILFVPWLGLFTWTGWGLAALAMTLMKFITLAIVTAYNAIASSLVSAINLMGNFVSGLFEAATIRILDMLGLDPTVCSGTGAARTCDDRLFHYTFSKVDTSFPGFPEFTKPTSFDTRTLIDVILSAIGINYSWGNQLRKIIFPTED